MLFENRSKDCYLIRRRTDERFLVDAAEWEIGKTPKEVGLTITNNSAVSRVHAEIMWMDDIYVIKDLGSVNGTFVHGRKLEENQSVDIYDGDIIFIANEQFKVETQKHEQEAPVSIFGGTDDTVFKPIDLDALKEAEEIVISKDDDFDEPLVFVEKKEVEIPKEMPAFCLNCGFELEPDSNFCSECGFPVKK